MVLAGEDPHTLDAIVVTHEHIDHVAGLPVMARKLGIPVYFTEATHRAWVRQMTPRTTMSYAKWLEQRKAAMAAQDEELERAHAARAEGSQDAPDDAFFAADATDLAGGEQALSLMAQAAVDDLCDELCDGDIPAKTGKGSAKDALTYLPAVEFFRAGSHLAIGDIDIMPFTIPHDAADPCGFVFESEGIRVGFATDLGYVPQNVKLALKKCDMLMLESNHDLEMLRDGPYPWSVKQRVLSRTGHLSNTATAEFLAKDYDRGAAYIVLGHLSESNNMPEMALAAAEQAIGNQASLLGNRILLAQQSAPLESLSL
jgi:phosphoribosyl 1,2-cyclic phosphodiesterase